MAAVQDRMQNQDEHASRDYRMDRFVGGALQSDIRSPSNGFTSGRSSRVLFIESHSVGPVLIVDSDRLCYRTRGLHKQIVVLQNLNTVQSDNLLRLPSSSDHHQVCGNEKRHSTSSDRGDCGNFVFGTNRRVLLFCVYPIDCIRSTDRVAAETRVAHQTEQPVINIVFPVFHFIDVYATKPIILFYY